ncbi:MAG: 23S rRNA (adenine(2030)-N(6))-methyltransferase RlmJ [Lysobacter sp.]|jgi:23S rRNA (adenine2030-N6)-methyltransferase|uniref:Ribosomal RNA large subunit methyltransferase J n=1 Tax=Lysobacter zhanggongensis TaxID=1774951 RepID=A0ABU7YME6_9GAMM|nr:23S rRNA (adenine(2030)-N(6))-methyltransferase RlmJ [Lysobacter sp.]MDV5979856.1 23S rRNA (adenine(2030)-N(6))-methyltransferase RlmJ [Lysobacter sp.]
MNYRHAFHAGNHADVLKHVTLLALCDALTAKPTPLFALDTHAGRGLYALDSASAQRTGEAEGGIGRLMAEAPKHPAIARYLSAVRACRAEHGNASYPGSPWLLGHALREQDRIAACELMPEEATQLAANFAADPRVAAHTRDGYAAMKALLPPRIGTTRFARGLVLIDPPYEAQLEEFDTIIGALRDALVRWPQGTYAVWYPIKRRRSLLPFFRRATTLPAKGVLLAELMVHPDDSPLRMNGSGMLLVNPPWQLDQTLQSALPLLQRAIGEAGAASRTEWLKRPA